MLLTVDIGNTQIAIGLFDNKQIKAHWRFSSSPLRTEDESWILVKALCEGDGFKVEDIHGVVVSSVVPNVTPVYEKLAQKYLSTIAVVVDASLDTGIKILYENPMDVGPDRICNAVAGYRQFGGPLIIVDFGTATTFDIISKDAEYLGGIIAPGIESTASTLHHRAARLPKVELRFPDKLIGTNTESSIQSGLMYGAVEIVDGLVRRIWEDLGETTQVIATGGLARTIIHKLSTVKHVEPFLTLVGLQMIYERVKK